MPSPLSPAPVKRRVPDALPPYLSNGVLGIRFPGVPYLSGTTMINGFAGLHPNDGVEGFARAPFVLAADVQLAGVWASAAPEWIRVIEQRYDFATAELHTLWSFRVDGTTATIETTAFCSRTVPALAACDVQVRVDSPADVALAAGIDPTGVPGYADSVAQPQDQGPNEDVDGRLLWHSSGDISTVGMAYTTSFHGGSEAEREAASRDERGWFSTSYRLRARTDRRYRLSLLSAVVPVLSHARPDEQAGRLAAVGAKRGFDGLRLENAAAWDELWQGRIELDGADARWQAITDASVFYLLASTHSASLASTSLFGLAYWPNYHYYHGHVMWDIETFTVPPLLLLAPDSAHALLDYRFRHLTAAHHNAALHGWRGAMYPWESCPEHGEESTPGARPYTEDHVSADVALAFAGYIQATGDADYARRIAWPVMRSVAEFIVSRVIATKRGFEILATVGPREVYQVVDNNAYTNMSAATALRAAADCATMIGATAPALWRAIADRLVLPRDRRRSAIINHDGAKLTESQGGVPESAAGLFPIGYRASSKEELATYRYAAVEQAPLYVGAPMLSALLPVYAARGGEATVAAELLERGYGDFINEPFLEPDEYPRSRTDRPRASPMFANLSGYLTSLLYGFTGIQLGHGDPGTWSQHPVTMPEGWRGIHVERIWVRGGSAALDAQSIRGSAEIVATSRAVSDAVAGAAVEGEVEGDNPR
jgi:trehalose/maltose hydrolase-like predicted phosphorylase